MRDEQTLMINIVPNKSVICFWGSFRTSGGSVIHNPVTSPLRVPSKCCTEKCGMREEGRWIFFEDVCVCGGAESWWVLRSRLYRAGGDPASAHVLPWHSKQTTTGLLKQCDGFTAGWLCFQTKNINVFGAPARHCCASRVTKGQLCGGLNALSTLGGIKCWLAFWYLPKALRAYTETNATRVRVLWYSYPMRCKCWYQKHYAYNATFLRGIILKLCL